MNKTETSAWLGRGALDGGALNWRDLLAHFDLTRLVSVSEASLSVAGRRRHL